MTIRPKTRQRVLILLTAIALLLSAGVGLYVYRQHHNEIEAQERRETGLAAFERGDYDAAIDDLARYAMHDAQDVQVLRALARSHDQARPQTPDHRAAAIRFYRQAYRLDPTHEPTAKRYVEISVAYGQYEQVLEITQRLREDHPRDPVLIDARLTSLVALARFEQIVDESDTLLRELDPGSTAHAVALERRVLALHELGRSAAAMEEASQLVSRYPDRFRSLVLAWRTRSTDQDADALLDWAKKLHEKDPEDVGRVVILAFANRRAGNVREAIDLLERAAAMEPEDPQLLRALAPALGSVGRMRIAADLLLELHAREPATDLLAQAARYVALSGQGDRLLELTEHAREEIDTLPIEAIALRALALCESGRSDEARPLVEALSQGNTPPAARAWAAALRGRFLDELDDPDDPDDSRDAGTASRIRLLRDALSSDPDHLWANAWLAEVYRNAGENELAARHLAQAVAREPGWLPPRLSLADLLRDKSEFEASLEAARQAWMIAPRNSAAAARSFVISASHLPDTLDDNTQQRLLELSQQLLDQVDNDPQLTAARARLLHATAGNDAATRYVQTQVEQADAAVLRELLAVDRQLDLGLRDPLVQALADRGTDADSDTLTRLALDPQNPEAAAEAIADILQQPAHQADPTWWARYARALDAAADPKAIDAWRRAVSFGGDEPRLLRAALDSPSVLREPDFYRELVSRLRSSTADDAVGWKIAEARYLLAHEPGGDAARRAEGLLREVIELSPRRGEALVLLAEAHRRLGDRDGEIAMLERAWRHPGEANADLGLRLVDLHLAAGEPQRADAALDRLAAADDLSTADARRIAGKLLESSRVRDAVGLLEDHTQGDAQAARELVPMLADAYVLLGRRAEAVQRFADVLPAAHDAETLWAAVRFFARLNETQRARELLDRLAEVDPAHAAKRRVEFASRWGDDGELERVLDEAGERAPGSPWVHLARIQHRWEHNDMEGVATAIQRARGELPEHETFAALERALPLVRSFSEHAGIRILFRGMLDSPEDTEACLDAMQVLAAVERGEAPEESAADELVSLAEASRAEPVVAAAAGLLIDMGRLRAAAELTTSHMRDTASPRLAEIATRAWVALGEPASAMPAAFAWHRRDPNNPRAAAMIVRASAMMGKPQDRLIARLSAILESLAAQPEPGLTDLREISLALLSDGRDDRVRDTLMPLLDDAGPWRRLWLGLAVEAMSASNSRVDAMAWVGPLLDHAELADPDETTAISDGLRRIAERLDNEDFAQTRLELLDKALESYPTHLGLLQHRAITLEQIGETEQATDAYERVLERDPDNVIALNNLALLLSELGRDLDRARSLIDRAIAQRPRLAALHDTRGEVLSAMDRSDEATAAYETAISLQPQVLKWRVHLARHLASTEDWQRTRQVLDDIETMAGLRADAVPGELRNEYLAIREAAQAAPAAE